MLNYINWQEYINLLAISLFQTYVCIFDVFIKVPVESDDTRKQSACGSDEWSYVIKNSPESPSGRGSD